MVSPQAPGKGAFDMHTAALYERQGDNREFKLEQAFTYGFTRDLAVRLEIPFELAVISLPRI